LGARSINEAAVEAFRAAPFRVLHAAGHRDYDALVSRVGGDGYDLRPYIDEFGDALAACDLCVARAGGSVFEIAAAGKPAVLVPYPHASADHQTTNARWMADVAAAVVVPDGELTAARLGREVAALLADPARLAAMAAASASLARPDAAQAVADEVLAAASSGAPRSGRSQPRSSSGRSQQRASSGRTQRRAFLGRSQRRAFRGHSQRRAFFRRSHRRASAGRRS
jgi:UDP-N-acetylglucosamine--N-acetylmuramyl-(pentapeptide) pyrophosphoryl-undecaprenol N-acetylglucosamine transferase